MAQLEVHGIDELMAKLDHLGRFEDVAPKMMKAGMKVLQEAVVEKASEHIESGQMVASIKPTGLLPGRNGGYYMCTRPTGYDSKKKLRNMEKLVYLEFGVKGRPATPIITSAIIKAEPGVIAAMREIFAKEVGKI